MHFTDFAAAFWKVLADVAAGSVRFGTHGFQLRRRAFLGLVRGALSLLLGFGSVTHFEFGEGV